MPVRNCAEIGTNLQKIVRRLMADDNLVKLLYYTDQDPLGKAKLSDEEKKELIFSKLIKIVPKVGPKEDAKSLIVLRVANGKPDYSNPEFKNIELYIEVFTPLTQWVIKDSNLRPFAIMGQIEKSLKGKTVDGLGKLEGGGFELNFLSEEISCYQMVFYITTYD